MADDKLDQISNIINGGKGNVNQEYNSASAGLNLDQTVNQIKPGTLTYALNASVENFDANSVNYQNEQGNEFCVSFPEDYALIGTHFIQEQNKHIFFLVKDSDTNPGSEIGYMENNDCVYHTLVNAPCLNFKINNPIHKTVHKITNCTTEIYWTDGINPRRYLDLTPANIPYKLAPGSDLCDPIYTTELDCNQIKVQPNFSIPQLNVTNVVAGGQLISGTVQFAIQYSDASGNPFTSYYSITNPTPISDPQITTANFDYPVGKSVVLNITDLDVTGQFQYYNLAVIKTVNAISSVELVGTYFIEEASDVITYSGQDATPIKLSINDIFEKYPYYDIAQDLTAVQDVLVWDNLSSIDRSNYQSIASQISLKWETYEIPATENYSDELNATNLRGYLRDEVYAFEIAFLLANGKQTDSFHIPGREMSDYDRSFANVPSTSPDFIGEPDPDTDSSPYWKIYNTATVIGPATGPAIGNATPYEYGEFAYWESDEQYPCNTDVWGSLANQKIRHHKFPDVLVSPIFKNPEFVLNSGFTPVIQKNAVFPIGVKIDLDQVYSLIQSSNLTAEEKAEIVGFKILRGDRSTNASITGKGILRNIGKYRREEEDYYFPNYPYNDLGADPFLNATNNAWSDICESFTINITQLWADPKGGLSYAEIRYVDCNSNKTVNEKYYSTGSRQICSIGKPTVMFGVGSVAYDNYDVWTLRSIDPSFGDCCGGFRITWIDYIKGPDTTYVDGCLGSGPRSVTVKVVPGTKPVCVEYCNRCGIRGFDNPVSTVRTTACTLSTPQPPITSDPTVAYRQVFNSPETSFGQPFLGTVLKLENVMFGGGKAHFAEVKSNAKYKLLSKEAQEDALNASKTLGAITTDFNATAMFAAYQAYLTIYINGINRKNYAYSFNSIASYDYFADIDNGLGVKQRKIDLKQYLIPGVQAVGDDNPINNFQRESSVFIKTKGTDPLDPLPPLPFPNETPSLISSGIKEVSRFTISEANHCSTPAKEKEISVISYYASLKNVIPSQWGQIYSYDTIDTGFQKKLTVGTLGTATVFGGDTFISRFAFKTKLPFFIDNRVNAPDDSDIYYDEIGNIAYPKYWHSARSILKDYTITDVGVLSSIISYKAHNFDCPNSQLPGPPTATAESNPNRTFYDGYFYLFAYGIPNFYCETSYNLDLRQATNNRAGDFWPHVSTSIPDDWVQEDYVSIANDNTYVYNPTFSKQNKENSFSHLPPDWDSTKYCFTNYPFRTIYSDPQNTDADNRVNNWLTYRATSYFDFPQNFGNLISLDGIQNKAILARFENKSLLYNSLLTMDSTNPLATYVGNPRMFENPPIDFAETDLGYVGSQNKFLLKIPQGQVTIDAKRGQIFLVSGTQVVDLSAFGSGMNRFFTDHLAFEILRYFPDVNTDNHFNGIGLHGVYDSKFDRVIITKLDYIPLYDNIMYDSSLQQFYVEEDEVRTQVFLSDSTYFCNKSWTISYNVNTSSWISFHTYLPNFYIGENNFFYSGINGCCDDFDFVAGPIVPDPTTTTTSTTTTRPLECNIAGTAVVVYPTTTTTTTAPIIPQLVLGGTCFPGNPSGTIKVIGGVNGDTIKLRVYYSGSVGTDGAAYSVGVYAYVNSDGPIPMCFPKDTGIRSFNLTKDIDVTLTSSSMTLNTSIYYRNGTSFYPGSKYVQIVQYNGLTVNGAQLTTVCSGNDSGSLSC